MEQAQRPQLRAMRGQREKGMVWLLGPYDLWKTGYLLIRNYYQEKKFNDPSSPNMDFKALDFTSFAITFFQLIHLK